MPQIKSGVLFAVPQGQEEGKDKTKFPYLESSSSTTAAAAV